jgi:hypothetical protein
VLVGWRGVDLPAQLYRVGLFHRDGLTLWDSQWYGGHWTLSYSVIFPPIAGLIGVQATEVASAALAAWAFDRLVLTHFGPTARIGSFLFAAGTLAQVAIGQLPFLLGESLALAACVAASRRRWALCVALAVAASTASPLAAGFLVLAAVASLVASWPRRRLAHAGLAIAPALPVIVLGVLFPGQGMMPFPAADFAQLMVLFAGLWLLIPRRERALRIGAGLYLLAIGLSFAASSPMGGNISRLGECLGAPLAACVLWTHRRWLLAAAVLPLVGLQWSPAFATFTTNRSDPSTHAAYFSPLLGFLAQHAEPAGRVEIVPTRLHWEAAYAAPFVPLARGWERQLDTADNPLFYDDALNAASYRTWLVASGVRYVALPDAPLDYAATKEGRLLDAGVPGLTLAWQNPHWRVFEVGGAPGLVKGPARLVRLDGSQVVLDASAPGSIVVRVRYSGRWTLVDGEGCVHATPDGWTAVEAAHAGEMRLDLRLVGGHQC